MTVTGKIELSLDQKPQIIVKDPSQIKPADGTAPPAAAGTAPTPATPVPAPAPTTTRAPSTPPTTASLNPATPAPKPTELKKIALGATWSGPAQGGDLTRKDLAALFGDQGTASDNPEGDPTIVLFGDVPFLAPLSLAKKRLQLDGIMATVSKVNCPGLPIGSFSSQSFSGVFAGGFNRLNLITDLADQVVSIQLVDENPRQRATDFTDTGGYHTYNFINGRSKGNPDLVVKHQVVKEHAPRGVVVVETALLDPTDGENAKGAKPRTSSKLESLDHHQPDAKNREGHGTRPLVRPHDHVNLILRCVGTR